MVVTGTGELVNAVLFALARGRTGARGTCGWTPPTLEDAFVALTGTRLHEQHEEHKEGALA